MNFTKDFSSKTVKQLSAKGIVVTGIQAVPGFEGDKYFSGTAYILVHDGKQFLRTHSQVIVLATSSWNPTTDLE